MVLEARISDKRFQIILLVFILWASVIAVRLFYFTVINRSQAFSQMETESLEKGRIRALRGRILSVDGEILAMTKRISNLCLRTSVESSQISSLAEILHKELKIMRRQIMVKLAHAGNSPYIVLKKGLSASEIEHFSKLFDRNEVLFIKMEFKRVTKNKRIGRVEEVDGAFVGVSGFEKLYDEQLRGQDLIYEVMLDKHGEVIEKTYKEVSSLERGQDVYLTREEWP